MRAGEVLAEKYRLEKRLGLGGMGEVWSVTHTGTGREFAVKLMHAHSATSPSARQRFTREARVSAKINHPCVIDVLDVGETDDGCLYLVMELLDGLTLSEAFHGAPPLSIRDFLSIVLDVVGVLDAAHAVGVVHRDIKSSNIFLHRDRATGLFSPKVLDFGISKLAGNADASTTKSGAVLGSPRYMSPEQTRSAANVDHRADLWAIGVVLFEGLTGSWPHEGDSFSSLVVAICTIPPISIDQIAPNLPESIRSLVRDCLKPIDSRLASAEALAKRLEVALQDPSLAQIPLPHPRLPPSDVVRAIPTGLLIRPAARISSSSLVQARGSSPGRPSFDSVGNLTPVSGPYPVAMSVAATAPYPVANPMTPSGSYPVANPMTPSGTYPVANPTTPSGAYPIGNPPNFSGTPRPDPVFRPTAKTLAFPAVVDTPPPPVATSTGSAVVAMPKVSQGGTDPLMGTASAMSVEAFSGSSVRPRSQPLLAPTVPDFPEMPPEAAARSSGKRGVLAAVALLVLAGIVITVVSLLRSDGTSPASSGPTGSSDVANPPAPSASEKPGPASVSAAPIGTPRSSVSAAPALAPPSAAPSGSASAAPSTKSSASKVPPKAGKNPSKIEQLGSGL
jgi:serine/threonine protein kinase